MATCKHCGVKFDWGRTEERWVPLIPIGEDIEFDRTYQDDKGMLRAPHKLVCTGPNTVNITKLAVPVPAEHVMTFTAPVVQDEPRKKRKYTRKVKG